MPRRPVPELGPTIGAAAALIEFGGAILIAASVARALLALARGEGIDNARLAIIAGALGALGFKAAATLLKALELGSWHAIGVFAAIFVLRTTVKRLFLWERARLSSETSPLHKMQSPLRAIMLRRSVTKAN